MFKFCGPIMFVSNDDLVREDSALCSRLYEVRAIMRFGGVLKRRGRYGLSRKRRILGRRRQSFQYGNTGRDF